MKKLGIAPGLLVTMLGAPRGLEGTLGTLPAGAKVERRLRARPDLVVLFARSIADLEKRIARLKGAVGKHGLWIAWPKRTSGMASDLSQVRVRRIAETHGLVDYKIIAIDDTWSALRFARRTVTGGRD